MQSEEKRVRVSQSEIEREGKHKEFISWKSLIKRSCAHYMPLLIRMKIICFAFCQPQSESQSTFGHMSFTRNIRAIEYRKKNSKPHDFCLSLHFLIDMKAIYNTNKASSMLRCGLLSFGNCWSFHCVQSSIKIYSPFLHIFISRWPINQQ